MPLIERCVCNSGLFRCAQGFGLPMRECVTCGAWHQVVELDEQGLSQWYRNRYHNGIYSHSADHDYRIGQKRIAQYGGLLQSPVLDVGCGNGGFVRACRDAGVDVTGQDLGGDGADHLGPVSEMTGQYNTITLHDVLEHAPNPKAMLLDVKRLLAPGGTILIDFPDFFSPAGEHHWKPTEHLWMLTDSQLQSLFHRCGLGVIMCDTPIPGKRVYALACTP